MTVSSKTVSTDTFKSTRKSYGNYNGYFIQMYNPTYDLYLGELTNVESFDMEYTESGGWDVCNITLANNDGISSYISEHNIVKVYIVGKDDAGVETSVLYFAGRIRKFSEGTDNKNVILVSGFKYDLLGILVNWKYATYVPPTILQQLDPIQKEHGDAAYKLALYNVIHENKIVKNSNIVTQTWSNVVKDIAIRYIANRTVIAYDNDKLVLNENNEYVYKESGQIEDSDTIIYNLLFKDKNVVAVLDSLMELTGYYWYIDEDPDDGLIKFYCKDYPKNIQKIYNEGYDVKSYNKNTDVTNFANRIIVRGGLVTLKGVNSNPEQLVDVYDDVASIKKYNMIRELIVSNESILSYHDAELVGLSNLRKYSRPVVKVDLEVSDNEVIKLMPNDLIQLNTDKEVFKLRLKSITYTVDSDGAFTKSFSIGEIKPTVHKLLKQFNLKMKNLENYNLNADYGKPFAVIDENMATPADGFDSEILKLIRYNKNPWDQTGEIYDTTKIWTIDSARILKFRQYEYKTYPEPPTNTNVHLYLDTFTKNIYVKESIGKISTLPTPADISYFFANQYKTSNTGVIDTVDNNNNKFTYVANGFDGFERTIDKYIIFNGQYLGYITGIDTDKREITYIKIIYPGGSNYDIISGYSFKIVDILIDFIDGNLYNANSYTGLEFTSDLQTVTSNGDIDVFNELHTGGV